MGRTRVPVGAKPVCIYCGCDQLGSPDDPPAVGSPIICGQCCALMVLDCRQLEDDGALEFVPVLRRCENTERQVLAARADVKAFLAAYQADQITSRLRAPKRKIKDIGSGGRARVHEGQQVRLTLKGPDAR